MTRDEQLQTIREALADQAFAVFAFAADAAEAPPYSAVMFFAATPELGLIFGTSPGSVKADYLRTGNGACVQVDNRAVGLENMSQFARITVQGRLRQIEASDEVDRLHGIYFDKLPNAKPFMSRPGVLTYLVEPERLVFARGFAERFELDFPAPGS